MTLEEAERILKEKGADIKFAVHNLAAYSRAYVRGYSRRTGHVPKSLANYVLNLKPYSSEHTCFFCRCKFEINYLNKNSWYCCESHRLQGKKKVSELGGSTTTFGVSSSVSSSEMRTIERRTDDRNTDDGNLCS